MKKFEFIFSFLILSLSLSFSQGQKGKITGKIVDDRTNETLIGVNVLVEGTGVGATTDINGRYVILNLQPGKYSVTASMIGYGKVTKTDVEVFIDRTSELNFRLKDVSIQIQDVVVVAEKPKIIKDQTSTSTTLDNEQIKVAAVEGIRGIMDLTASFQKNEQGHYQVRGSGAYEINFQINGVEQVTSATNAPGAFGTSKANNSWKYDVNPIGVQQLQLISGGFTAEYGNAQAGVVKVVMKEGTPKFNGEVRVEYRPPGQYHFGPYLYDQNNYEFQRWGKLENWMAKRNLMITELKLDTRYKAFYQQSLTDSSAKKVWDELVDREITWAYSVWMNNHTPSDNNPLGVYDYRSHAYIRYLFGFGGPLGKDPNLFKFFLSGEYRKNPTRLPTPERVQIYQNYILNVTYKPLVKHKFKLMAAFQKYRGGIWSGSEDIRWSGIAFSPPGVSTKYLVTVDPVRTEQTVSQSLNWVYTISDKSFVEATISHQQEKYELPYEYLAGFGVEVDRLDSLNDPRGSVLKDGIWWENAYFRQPFNFSTNYYQDQRSNHWSLSVDYTNQIIPTNLIKTGARFYYWDMFNNGVNSSFQANTYVVRSGFAEYYRAFPISLSFYIQDKMEYEGMIANLGVRAEAFNFQTPVPEDRFNIFYQGTSGPGQVGNPATVPSKTQFIILPRLGLSFPIGELTAFRIQYGHFASMPIFSQALSQRTESGWIGYGNPDLDPKKTISYEFGLQQVVDENHRLDMVLFYNDRATQIGIIRVASFTGSRNRPAGFTSDNIPLYAYSTFENNAFGSSLGLEVILEKISRGNWMYRLSYTLSQTTEGNFGPQMLYPDNTRSYEKRDFTGEFISSFDRTHNFRGMLQYNVDQDGGLSIFGFKPFSNSNFSLTYTAQSGTPFTYRTTFDLKDVVNNRRYPLESSFDFNAIRNFNLWGFRMILRVRAMNLFDNKWITPMSTDDDVRNWVEQGITVMDPGNDLTRLSYVVAPYRAFRNIPRQVFITLGVGF
ncbi:MAG: TonB-dependent receptor [Bacteroidetes bacterium]|nr:TonB-dependent receptor [Bacteroidota bacterium]MBU2586158.1 TonB-dependent receptor [Bacteroidota bacterium]